MASFSKPPIDVLTSSGAIASPCTRTAGGSNSPLPVGSEKSRETRGLRRMLNALSGSPIEVVVMNWPVSARQNGSIGVVCPVNDWSGDRVEAVSEPDRLAVLRHGLPRSPDDVRPAVRDPRSGRPSGLAARGRVFRLAGALVTLVRLPGRNCPRAAAL